MKQFLSLTLAIVATFVTGCASFSGQLLDRNPENTDWQTKEVRGIPITVKVPTHIEVRVYQESYYHHGKPLLGADGLPIRATRVEHDTIETSKIFTVDMKRPAAGTANPHIDFEDQYVRTMKNEVNDQTIEAVSTLIATVNRSGGLGALFRASPAAESGAAATKRFASAGLFHIDQLVAAQVFEFADPMVREKIEAFLDEHINQCASQREEAAMVSSRRLGSAR
ncbi:MAG: hypothetical protein NT069_24625 [Planctomycetota bacterium]|nr:hypothetical protein [Planctomycetota bacterium]